MKEEEFYTNMLNLDICEDLMKDIDDIIDEEDSAVTDENTPVRLRKKYRSQINDLFEEKAGTCEDLFSLSYILIQQFNINPESFLMCLEPESRIKLRNYALNKYNTDYHIRREKILKNKSDEDPIEEYVDIREYFIT